LRKKASRKSKGEHTLIDTFHHSRGEKLEGKPVGAEPIRRNPGGGSGRRNTFPNTRCGKKKDADAQKFRGVAQMPRGKNEKKRRLGGGRLTNGDKITSIEEQYKVLEHCLYRQKNHFCIHPTDTYEGAGKVKGVLQNGGSHQDHWKRRKSTNIRSGRNHRRNGKVLETNLTDVKTQ